jgi:RHS repeat-associated protein
MRSIHRYLVDRLNPTGYAQVLEEKDGNGQLVARHLYGHDLIASDIRNLQSSIINRQWYAYDGLGSVRGLTDDTGVVQETYDYDAYGTLIGFTKRNGAGDLEIQNPQSTILNPQSAYLFTGEQWDADLGMYFLRARYLNPGTGRFHTEDSYEGRNGEPLTLHKYLYAHANPVMNLDPSGHLTLYEQALVLQIRTYNYLTSGAPAVTYASAVLSVLSIVAFISDPETFVASVGSPGDAAGILAADLRFAVGMVVRTGQFIKGASAARAISHDVQEALSVAAAELKAIDPDALIGIRGSLARGYKGPHKGNDPFNEGEFDVDAFIISDKIDKIPASVRKAADVASGEISALHQGLKENIRFLRYTHKQYQTKSRFNRKGDPNVIVD